MRAFSILSLIALSIYPGICAGKFGPGAIEVSGAGAFEMNMRESGSDSYQLILSPAASFYYAHGAYLGPWLMFMTTWNDFSSTSANVLGVNAGFVIPTETAASPYLGFSIGRISSRYEYESSFDNSSSGSESNGFVIPVYMGLKVDIGQSFFLNIQPTFTYTDIEDRTHKSAGIQFGISGMIGTP